MRVSQPNHKEYSVWLNVCEVADGCEWWPPEAIQILDAEWQAEPITIRWEDIGKIAKTGYVARIYWTCTVRPPGGGLVIFWQVVTRTVTGRIYLPIMVRN